MKTVALLSVVFHLVYGVVNVNDIRQYVTDSFACSGGKFQGLTISVVDNDQVIYSDGFGVKESGGTAPVTSQTLFGIGGLTKAFSAALISKIMDDPTISHRLDHTIRHILQDKSLFDSYLRSRYATTRDLLTHRMGFVQHNFMRLDDTLTRTNLYERLRTLPVKSRFRDSFRYNNLMYGYVTHLAEKLAGKTFEELVSEHLFVPLQMDNSTFFTTAILSTLDLAKGYLDDYGTPYEVPEEFEKKWSELCGANCILSSAEDMAKWMMFNLNYGRTPRGRVMEKNSVRGMHTPWNRIQSASIEDYFVKPKTPRSLTHDSYGLGWKLGMYNGYPISTHGGSTYGYDSLITLVPGQNIGVYTAVSGNDYDYLFMTNIHNKIIDMLLDEPEWVNATFTCSFSAEHTPVRSKPIFARDNPFPFPLTDYVGVYENPSYGRVEITEDAAGKGLNMKYGYADFELFSKDVANTVAPTNETYMESFGITAKIIDDGTLKFLETDELNPGFDKIEIPGFEDDQPPIFVKS